MKIERISENQIRCTLYKADLADKELLLTELAYGTDKAKELFRELMQQASNELGFEVDNIPLMIEAIPVSKDCLVLIITKVEDPDELDTRFSRFTKPVVDREFEEETSDYEDELDVLSQEESEEDEAKEPREKSQVSGGFLEALGSLAEGLSALGAMGAAKKLKPDTTASSTAEVKQDIFRMYAFKSLDQVIKSANLISDIYVSRNSLYKNEQDGVFYLVVTKDDNTDAEFIRCCNVIGEYGNRVKTTYATPDYLKEHYKLIIEDNAIETLARI